MVFWFWVVPQTNDRRAAVFGSGDSLCAATESRRQMRLHDLFPDGHSHNRDRGHSKIKFPVLHGHGRGALRAAP